MRALSLASAALAVLLALPTMAQQKEGEAAIRPLRVYGNTSTLELAPVLLAAQPAPVVNGGVPNLFNPGEADVATNAETQALRVSVDHPDLRIILTVSEGFYRIVARRSAGIAKLADLRGKKIGTVPRTSAAYYLNRMLATVGLTEADVTIVSVVPLNKVPAAMKNGEIDAVAIWEPEVQIAKNQLAADAIEFQDRTVYRELFNLNTTAAALADPARRQQIVALVRSIIRTSAQIRRDPQAARAALVKSTGYDEKLIEQVWHHEGYPGTLVPDLLDVLVHEESWVAKERNRTAPLERRARQADRRQRSERSAGARTECDDFSDVGSAREAARRRRLTAKKRFARSNACSTRTRTTQKPASRTRSRNCSRRAQSAVDGGAPAFRRSGAVASRACRKASFTPCCSSHR